MTRSRRGRLLSPRFSPQGPDKGWSATLPRCEWLTPLEARKSEVGTRPVESAPVTSIYFSSVAFGETGGGVWSLGAALRAGIARSYRPSNAARNGSESGASFTKRW